MLIIYLTIKILTTILYYVRITIYPLKLYRYIALQLKMYYLNNF